MIDQPTCRRRFLQYLAASPLLAGTGAPRAGAARCPIRRYGAPRTLDKLIGSPREALDVFDFEPVMHQNVPPAHFGYMATGIDDEVTLRANREGFQKFQLRPRRLVDVGTLDLRMELFGQTYASPIVLAPTGVEPGLPRRRRACRRARRPQAAITCRCSRPSPPPRSRRRSRRAAGRSGSSSIRRTSGRSPRRLARRAEKAGAQTIVVTVDVLARQNWETLVRLLRTDTRDCGSCHALSLASFVKRKPNFDGLDITGVNSTGATNLTWEFVKRLRDTVKTRLVVKGLMTAEDAMLAVDNGLDGIVVSNHGGRAEDSGRSTIDALPEILEAVGGRIPVLVDSGFRRGTDIAKALAMGARAVCIGRPYLWGLGAFGQPGVERVLDLLQQETRAAMMQLGAPSLKHLVPAMVRRA